MNDDVEEAEDTIPPTPPVEGWTLRNAILEVIDENDWVRLSTSDESERHYAGRLRDLERDPDPRDRRGNPIDIAGLRNAHRNAAEQARVSRTCALRELRNRIEAGDLTASGMRGTAAGAFEPIPAHVWSALDWLDLETNAVGEVREGGARWVGVRIFDAGGERTIATPRGPSPYPNTEAGMVAVAFDVLRPNGKDRGERNDALRDKIRAHLGFGGSRPSDSTITKGIGLSNERHGRTSKRGGNRKSVKSPGNGDEGVGE